MTKLLLMSFLMVGLRAQIDFPLSYNESRDYFRSRVIKKGGELTKNKVKSKIDDDLTIDVGYFAATDKSEKLIILNSGIHGPEAYLGSFAQKIFLESYIDKIDRSSTSILIVHVINPYGFKYGRRVSEDNIDLNRNMSLKNDIFLNTNIEHKQMLNILAPSGKVSGLGISSILFEVAKKLIMGTPLKVIRNGVTSGQYEYDRSIYFGGENFSDNRNILLKIFSEKISIHKKILSFDFHTGLGEKGVLHLISGNKNFLSKESIDLQARLFNKSDSINYKLTTADTPGFYSTTGDMNDFISEIAGKEKLVIAMTAEFGTMGLSLWEQLKTINRMIKENQGHHYGYKNSSLEKKVKSDFISLFNPIDDHWRFEVERRIIHLYKKPLKVFNNL